MPDPSARTIVQVDEHPNAFKTLKPEGKIDGVAVLPFSLPEGAYRVYIGFGPFKRSKDFPPGEAYFEGELVAPPVPYIVPAED